MTLTQHAKERSHQRCIQETQLDWLMSYGCLGHNKGAHAYYFDRDGFEQLINEVSEHEISLAYRSRDIYAVVIDSKVITLGYRDDRFKPQKSHRRVRHAAPANPAARRLHHKNY
jgi:hypothetical protein